MNGKDFEPRIVAFLCQWCSYAGADLAGTSRLSYPPNVRIIRVPCSGRMNALFVVKLLENGIDGVFVSGCHPDECHYTEGNYYARRRFLVLRELLAFMGIDPRRFQAAWISAAEGRKFAETMKQVVEEIRAAGPNPGVGT